ncbi:PTS fructose transporter subunit IIA [Superficieibacter electus]|uniref:PTS fructose transporter subunit IIA n=1 Tax=Superficieibacter electus TaxID=2022662 RepID=A0A2P5GUQ6_9ENTR|nr:PTS sugar transporter subunit IIA [Superficieibacter electus]POP44290.1 PTS fructose transporter subunit IIA [Superficieibacter electus]POP50308.1 PTS fructose transporter subunit IIA [Superficieibacter electus]
MDQKIMPPWLVVISHGNFGKELVNSCEMILGKVDNIYCFSLEPGMAPEQLLENVTELLHDAPQNVVIFTDIYAGTPSNVATIFAKQKRYQVICGMNLPMLIEAEMQRYDVAFEDLIAKIIAAGNDSIINITSLTHGREYE